MLNLRKSGVNLNSDHQIQRTRSYSSFNMSITYHTRQVWGNNMYKRPRGHDSQSCRRQTWCSPSLGDECPRCEGRKIVIGTFKFWWIRLTGDTAAFWVHWIHRTNRTTWSPISKIHWSHSWNKTCHWKPLNRASSKQSEHTPTRSISC